MLGRVLGRAGVGRRRVDPAMSATWLCEGGDAGGAWPSTALRSSVSTPTAHPLEAPTCSGRATSARWKDSQQPVKMHRTPGAPGRSAPSGFAAGVHGCRTLQSGAAVVQGGAERVSDDEARAYVDALFTDGTELRPCTSAQGGADAVRLMRAFNMSPLLWQEAGVLGLEATETVEATTALLRQLKRWLGSPRLHALAEALRHAEATGGVEAAVARVLCPLFKHTAMRQVPRVLGSMDLAAGLAHAADMSSPGSWYPKARAMQRTIIFHMGPTNSGKTFQALERYNTAESGVYASPLRLLAMEVWDQCNQRGTYCSLITGQEKEEVAFSQHTACTVEMVDTNRVVEVGVIDEIQLLADPDRGWAWTRALYGMPARELHVCGDPTALHVLRRTAEALGDRFKVQEYTRITPLALAPHALGDYGQVMAGDCVVAFSRRDIFDIKTEIERLTTMRCCVVYGALPPETRRMQAKLFNEQGNGYDVLVASDAIGMGLNLNIRRVIFHRMHKYTGNKDSLLDPVPATQVKQIAGRAGRHGTEWEQGWATCLDPDDLPLLYAGVAAPPKPAAAAGLFPMLEQLQGYAGLMPRAPLAQVFEAFMRHAKVDEGFFMCNHAESVRLAGWLSQIQGMSLAEQFGFMVVPVNTRDEPVMDALVDFATQYAQSGPVKLRMEVDVTVPTDMEGLAELEAKYRVVALYRWLSLRMEELAAQCGREVTFPDTERAAQLSQQLSKLLNQGLPACVSRRRYNLKDRDRQGGGGGGYRDQSKPFDSEAVIGRLRRATKTPKEGRDRFDSRGNIGSATTKLFRWKNKRVNE